MATFKVFHFKPSKIYGIPNWFGLALFVIVGSAFYYSIVNQSWVERWISVCMVLIILFHLLELNDQFRSLSYQLHIYFPPFAGEEIILPFQIQNSHSSPSEIILIKLEGSKNWVECPPIPAGESRLIQIPFYPKNMGKQPFPVLKIKMRSSSNLFSLWQKAKASETVSILPKAKDHGIHPLIKSNKLPDDELSTIELMRDPRLFLKMDQKLYLKTGKPYLRTYQNSNQGNIISLRWNDLININEEFRQQQFSFWIKYYQEHQQKAHESVFVETPFFTQVKHGGTVPWDELKISFSDWLNEK